MGYKSVSTGHTCRLVAYNYNLHVKISFYFKSCLSFTEDYVDELLALAI